MWRLHILGTNSAVPQKDRSPSAQALDISTGLILVDCGEGTLSRILQFGLKPSKINHILISHLHGDHVFGLPGLITSYGLYRRSKPLVLYGPIGLRRFIMDILHNIDCRLQFELVIREHGDQQVQHILQNRWIEVETIPLQHRVPTTGYLIREKVAARRINPEAIAHYQVPYVELNAIKEGNDWTRADGQVIDNTLLTSAGRRPISYAYVSDTVYHPTIIPQIEGVDLLYHEATFLEQHAKEASERFHSTARQAALVASEAEVGQLVLGHFSSRYRDLNSFALEAKEIFERVIVAEEGMMIEIDGGGHSDS